MSILEEKYFWNEAAAYEFVEAQMWPKGPVCPHCGTCDNIRKLNGATTRIGTYKCYHCHRPFTVKIGTIFEASRLPMHVWLQSIYLIAQSDSLMPVRELEQALGISTKTAKVIAHRLHKAMLVSQPRKPGTKTGQKSRISPAGKKKKHGQPEEAPPQHRLPAIRDFFSSMGAS